MRDEAQIQAMFDFALVQRGRTRAPDYLDGAVDALHWVLTEDAHQGKGPFPAWEILLGRAWERG